jgi:hypothetical protein
VKPGYRVLNTNTLSILNASEPRRVLGELENKSVIQAACGNNHTVRKVRKKLLIDMLDFGWKCLYVGKL